MINAAEAQRVRTDRGRRAHIPATVQLLCVCVRMHTRAEGVEVAKSGWTGGLESSTPWL